ncbi:MAG: DUF2946 domain-containing protein [Burkholderiaceae bacterium]
MSIPSVYRVLSRRSRRLLAGWLGALMLFAAIAPSVTHLLAAASGAPTGFAQICGVGADDASIGDLVAAASGEPDDHDHGGGPPNLDHCPFCGAGGTMPWLMPPAAFVVVTATTTDARPRLFLRARRTLFAWAPARSRGPPSMS